MVASRAPRSIDWTGENNLLRYRPVAQALHLVTEGVNLEQPLPAREGNWSDVYNDVPSTHWHRWCMYLFFNQLGHIGVPLYFSMDAMRLRFSVPLQIKLVGMTIATGAPKSFCPMLRCRGMWKD